MTFKPELLGFVSIVWGIYLIDLFKKKKEIEFLYYLSKKGDIYEKVKKSIDLENKKFDKKIEKIIS